MDDDDGDGNDGDFSFANSFHELDQDNEQNMKTAHKNYVKKLKVNLKLKLKRFSYRENRQFHAVVPCYFIIVELTILLNLNCIYF